MIEKLLRENINKFLADGPRLHYDYNIWIGAKDSVRKRVLVCGLGSMGVGQMWFEETEEHKKLSNYNEAIELNSYKGFGTND